ncbi:LAMI_0C04060g1_1 [Lachancea mirantina]|uniref:Helicase SWR1 n=1 Tax=Lachancea mirantina TaxID=1230905 RepID=A0A1G4J220_9SACH|nr:LAMI_0C04060g1_1 [Lachancea mirantina]
MSKRDEELAEIKFKYELLVNELFHLKEFTSLLEYDPSYRNSSASFDSFLSRSKLDMSAVSGEIKNESTSSARRIRSRQVRNEQSALEDCISRVKPRVDEKYEELRCMLNQESYKRKPVVALREPVKSVKRQKVEVITAEQELPKKEKTALKEEPVLSREKGIDEFYFTTSSEEDENEPKRRRRKKAVVKLTVNPPKQTITNHLHVVKPQFGSIRKFLGSFKSLDEHVTLEEFDNYVTDQKRVFQSIKKGIKNGVLQYDPDSNSLQPITLKDAAGVQAHRPDPVTYFYKEQNQHTHWDHVINQGIVSSRLVQEARKARISRARKVSMMIEQHFRHIAGAEQRKQREEDKRMKNLARSAAQAVKKRWMVAEKAYKVLKTEEEEQLKKIQGKRHLSKVLEQSTQLLGAQFKHLSNDSDDEDLEDSLHSDRSNLSESDAFTTSSSESESMSDAEDDARLSVEQLQAKYANMGKTNDDTAQVSDLESERGSSRDAGSERQDDLKDTPREASDAEDASPDILDEDEDDDISGLSSSSSEGDTENEEAEEEGGSVGTKPNLATLLTDLSDEDDSAEEDDYTSPDEQLHSTGDTSTGETSMDESDSSFSSRAAQPNGTDKSLTNLNKAESEKDQPDETLTKPADDPLSVEDVPVPSLLRGTLRAYQKQGLNWLASLYNNKTNGILADEMGLGKTIQTISFLAYLACEKQNWGPHLIIVPTSVLLNWEMELKRFAPGFKVLTYYGSPQQRKEKRKGWNKSDAFHICITSYQLVVHDQHSFKRKKWQYMILDEAHNIKNFRSTRWQALLNFNTDRRLLLTGTPLQNNLAELWSLLYFLMPQTAVDKKGGIQGFADLEAFQQWFGRPVDKIIQTGEGFEQDQETKETVAKLHQVLRPYLLRRLKSDVEKQMPAKYEHIVYCRLSKRQRFLYDDFMSRAQTKATLASGNFMSIINCLMQLRKVCNHPDLFEVRPILTSLAIENCVMNDYLDLNCKISRKLHYKDHDTTVNLDELNFIFTNNDLTMSTHHSQDIERMRCISRFKEELSKLQERDNSNSQALEAITNFQNLNDYYQKSIAKNRANVIDKLNFSWYLNELRCARKPVYGRNLVNLLNVAQQPTPKGGEFFEEALKPLQTRVFASKDIIEKFAVVTPNVVTLDGRDFFAGVHDEMHSFAVPSDVVKNELRALDNPFHQLQTKLAIAFPDKSLLQYDCGKLQKLAELLRQLKDGGHRALIFTQMTKVLDILELFLNYHGYLYMRLDGATKIEDRQILTERFNSDPRVTAFILSSRSGGLGINLTGADSVIFYDSDWNPAMDKQCQDRCHRIGQTRDVHIYRFVSEHTIESNILKKANQKRHLDNVVIQRGDFTTDYFTKLSVKDLVGAEVAGNATTSAAADAAADKPLLLENDLANKDPRKLESLLAQAEDADDVKAAKLAMREVEVDDEDFSETGTAGGAGAKGATGSVQSDLDGYEDEYEGTGHVEEYMVRYIANGHYYE